MNSAALPHGADHHFVSKAVGVDGKWLIAGLVPEESDQDSRRVEESIEERNQQSLSASIKRVQAYLLKPECIEDFRDLDAVSNKVGTVGFSDQGMPQMKQYTFHILDLSI